MSVRWANPTEREEDEEEAFGVPRAYDHVNNPRLAIVRLPSTRGIQTKVLGPYRWFCWGRVVLGPQPCVLIFHTTLFLTLFGLFCLQFEDVSKVGGVGVWLGGLALYVWSISLFISVALTDPGVVPIHYSLHELIRDTVRYRARNPGARFYRFCRKCDGFRPPRCYHCKICNICIRGQQLHISVAGTCVGQRNVLPYLALSFVLGIFSWYLIVVNSVILSKVKVVIGVRSAFLGVIGLLSGAMLVLIPNIGFCSFFYRLYKLLCGREHRLFFEATRADELDCPEDQMSCWKRFRRTFCAQPPKSAFRNMRLNRVANSGRMYNFGFFDNLNNWLDTPPRIGGSTDSREIIQMNLPRHQGTRMDIINMPPPRAQVSQEEAEEALLLRALAANARLRQTPSVPDLDRSKRETPCCFRKSSASVKRPKTRKSKSKHRKVAPITAAARLEVLEEESKESKGVVTLSDGNIPSTLNGEELIQTARAEQFRRLIHLILIRDRNGILQMSRRVNLAGLLGLERFDPDNLQFVELSNGLPMIAPRRRDPQAVQNAAPNRFGGLLGIPQMVAAGLLPTARVMAQDVENSLGLRPGSVIRINNTVTLPLAFSRDASSAMPGRRPGSTPLTSRTSALRTERPFTTRLRNQAQEELNRLLTDQRRLLQTQEQTLQALRSLNENEMRPHSATSRGVVNSNRQTGNGLLVIDANNNNNPRNNSRHGTYYSTHEQESSTTSDE